MNGQDGLDKPVGPPEPVAQVRVLPGAPLPGRQRRARHLFRLTRLRVALAVAQDRPELAVERPNGREPRQVGRTQLDEPDGPPA